MCVRDVKKHVPRNSQLEEKERLYNVPRQLEIVICDQEKQYAIHNPDASVQRAKNKTLFYVYHSGTVSERDTIKCH